MTIYFFGALLSYREHGSAPMVFVTLHVFLDCLGLNCRNKHRLVHSPYVYLFRHTQNSNNDTARGLVCK